MQVLSLFLKIFKHENISVIIYISICMALAIVTTIGMDSGSEQNFEKQSISIAVVDNDNSEVTKGLTEYLKKDNKVYTDVKTKEDIRDGLYNYTYEYVITFEEGYGDKILNGEGEIPEITVTKQPLLSVMNGINMDMIINQYMGIIRSYASIGYSGEDAVEKADELMSKETKAVINEQTTKTSTVPKYKFYYNYLGYIYAAICISIIGKIMLSFNEKVVKRRSDCSPLQPWKKNLQIFMGCLIFGVAIWGLFNVLPFILYGDVMNNFNLIGYEMLNNFVYMILMLAVSFSVSIGAKRHSGIFGIGIVLPLALSFLGGIFVPQTMILSSSVLSKIVNFVPSFWFVKANEIICLSNDLTSSELSTIWSSIIIQAAFAAAIFALGIVYKKRRTE